MPGFVEIAPLPAVPLHDLFAYEVPAELRDRIRPGMRVTVPFGRATRTGVVAGVTDEAPASPGPLKRLLAVLDDEPFLPPDLLELCRWTARYYLTSLADVIGTVVPRAVPDAAQESVVRLLAPLDGTAEAALARKAPARHRLYAALRDAPDFTLSVGEIRGRGISPAAAAGLVQAGWAVREQRDADAVVEPVPLDRRPNLTAEQTSAVDRLTAGLATRQHATVVLHGVTGSGKTEVFLAAAEAALAAGGGAIVLVPEIALTHQAVGRVRARFGDTVAILHSGLAPRARWAEWRRLLDGRARVAVGARSAIFAPVRDLRLVVVDEEHDAAYKQEEGIRYHARDLAVVRARLANGICVLASATPSAESYQAALDGRHALVELKARPTAHPLPAVEVIDLRAQPKQRTDERPALSDQLHQALAQNLELGGQTLVFLNRRGFATYLQCPACGATASCPNCSVTLTWHRRASALVCHHCHHAARAPTACPECRGPELKAFGIGTEQIEGALQELFPLANVERLDRDVANRPAAQKRILADWREGATDILVGTQMVSKGHDIPGVTLVVVLLADLSLNMPDFRAGERTFQLLAQVGGRAGRGDRAGRVLLQTLRPDHPAIHAAATHDYAGFIAGELDRRRTLEYPPFARMVLVRVDGPDNRAAEEAARELAAALRATADRLGLDLRAVLGPATPPIERVAGRYRWQIQLRSTDVPKLRALARQARSAEPAMRRAKLRLVVDVDPQGM